MPAPSKKYALVTCVIGGIAITPTLAIAQGSLASDTSQRTCAGLLANAPEVQALGPSTTNDPASSRTNNSRTGAAGTAGSAQITADSAGRVGSSQIRSDTAAFGIGGA